MTTFWFIVFMTILVWYFFVTFLVAIKGFGNIKDMLQVLREQQG